MAADINKKLAEQTEKLRKIDEGLEDVQANLKGAARQLRSFARRLATDKLIIVFIFLILGGIIFVIVWSATHKGAKSSVVEYLIPNGLNVTNPLSKRMT